MIGRLMRCPEYPTAKIVSFARKEGTWEQTLSWRDVPDLTVTGTGSTPGDATVDAYERYRAVMWLRWHGWGRA